MNRFIDFTAKDGAHRRYKTCSVCGAFEIGAWLQHPNRDEGWGLCAKCRDWLQAKNPAEYTPERMADLYGLPGRNYEGRTHRLHGREFVIVAEFPEVEEARANAFMAKYPGASVLDVVHGRVVLAWSADAGVVAERGLV